jgi:hypothetical protein
VCGQELSGGSNETKLRQASDRLGAAVRARDTASAAKLLRDPFVFVDARGRVYDRSGALDSIGSTGGGDDSVAAIMVYGNLAQVTRKGRPSASGQLVAIEAWVNDGGAWRAHLVHLNTIADPSSPHAHPPLARRPPEAPPPRCENPLESVPYQPTSEAERGIIESFQALEKAVVGNRPEEWVNYVADEFVVYRTGQHPTTKAGRVKALRRQRDVNAETFVAEVESFQFWVFGDAAVMRADHVMPGNRRPPYRATRLWVKRNGRWLMASSQQTTRAA